MSIPHFRIKRENLKLKSKMRKGGQEETKALGRVANQCCNGSHGKTPLTQEHFNIGEECRNRNTPFNLNISVELSEMGFSPPTASSPTLHIWGWAAFHLGPGLASITRSVAHWPCQGTSTETRICPNSHGSRLNLFKGDLFQRFLSSEASCISQANKHFFTYFLV